MSRDTVSERYRSSGLSSRDYIDGYEAASVNVKLHVNVRVL